MGFRLRIEADYLGEVLQNDHPREHSSGDKAVLAFLSGLQNYCSPSGDNEFPELQFVNDWFQQLDDASKGQLCTKCRALLDCMWSDGGDSTVYQEDEWEFYKKRNTAMVDSGFTEAMFKKMVQDYDLYWKPIPDVIYSVRFLLDLFAQTSLEPMEGVYEPDATRIDFEALQFNLELLAKREGEKVRLNFV